MNGPKQPSTNAEKNIYTNTKDDHLEGEFRMGSLKNGFKNFTLYKGHTYKGEVRNGNRHKGLLTWKDGSSHEGQFHKNEPHGQGVYTSSEGKRYKGEFEDGKYVRGN